MPKRTTTRSWKRRYSAFIRSKVSESENTSVLEAGSTRLAA